VPGNVLLCAVGQEIQEVPEAGTPRTAQGGQGPRSEGQGFQDHHQLEAAGQLSFGHMAIIARIFLDEL
jgi:hypothetical protein